MNVKQIYAMALPLMLLFGCAGGGTLGNSSGDAGGNGGDGGGNWGSGGNGGTSPSNPFVGEFDCLQTAITFVGGQMSPPTDTELFLEATDKGSGVVRWLSPGTKQNAFQDCAALLDVVGDKATFKSGDNCMHIITGGTATANVGGGFTGAFDGNAAGYKVTIDLTCHVAPPGVGAESFHGDWFCSGTQNSMFLGMTPVTFGLRMIQTTRNKMQAVQTDGDMTAFAMCPSSFEASSSTAAALVGQPKCTPNEPKVPSSKGLTINGTTLSGDYGDPGNFSGQVTFTCTR